MAEAQKATGGFDPERFRENLKALLRNKKLSVVAKAAGCKAGTLWRYKEGRLVPSLEKAIALARALGVSLEELTGFGAQVSNWAWQTRLVTVEQVARALGLSVTNVGPEDWLFWIIVGSPYGGVDARGDVVPFTTSKLLEAASQLNDALAKLDQWTGSVRSTLRSYLAGFADRSRVVELCDSVARFLESLGITVSRVRWEWREGRSPDQMYPILQNSLAKSLDALSKDDPKRPVLSALLNVVSALVHFTRVERNVNPDDRLGLDQMEAISHAFYWSKEQIVALSAQLVSESRK